MVTLCKNSRDNGVKDSKAHQVEIMNHLHIVQAQLNLNLGGMTVQFEFNPTCDMSAWNATLFSHVQVTRVIIQTVCID